MKNLELVVKDVAELPETAKHILQFCKQHKIFAFYAEMGAGKTTLIKELCRQLGSADNFSSPTYSIVNEYRISPPNESRHPSSALKIYHIDLYRVKNIEEALALGIEDYLNGDAYCFIEWPQLIEPVLPHETVKIYIQTDYNNRNVSIFIGT